MIETENKEEGRSLQPENKNQSSLVFVFSFHLDITGELLQIFSQGTDMNNLIF